MTEIRRDEGLEAHETATVKCQLRKGKQGEERADAEYYWSPVGEPEIGQGSVHKYPAPDRYPIYRTTIPRRQWSNGHPTDL